jgi:hypothetical protein
LAYDLAKLRGGRFGFVWRALAVEISDRYVGLLACMEIIKLSQRPKKTYSVFFDHSLFFGTYVLPV